MMKVHFRDFEQARRLERGLIAVRWFGVIFAAVQVSQARTLEPTPPEYTTPFGFVLTALLTLGNIVVAARTRRAARAEQLTVIGMVAFALDIAVALGLVWLYSHDENSVVWVASYILPLEGAIRYRLNGALFTIGLLALSETLRELYLDRTLEDYGFQLSLVSFRIGIAAIIALVAGFMARSLERETEKARDRANLAEEAARRATAARRELDAFQTAILAGVAAEGLQESLRSMTATIGRDLGFECLSILLMDGDHLVAKARYGTPPRDWVDRLPPGSGVAGRVAASCAPLRELLSSGGAAAAAPLTVGEQLIGVLEVSATDPGDVTEDTLDVLTRLADQIALVVHSAELRAHQAETLERLRELDQMKSDFVAITSHELRTPLTAVRGFVRTLIRNFDLLSRSQVEDSLSMIDRQSERLTRLVEDLLVVSRIEAGTITVAPVPVDLRAFLRDVAGAFGLNRDRIRLRLSRDLPEWVVLDPHRVEQVLTNLLQNATKFSPSESTVTLAAAMEDGRIRLAVVDRGIGIASEQLPHIFDRFHQAAPALTREAEGAGLGLYISKRLVEAMHGDIGVASKLGGGSTFTFRLPLRETSGGEPVRDPRTDPEPRTSAPT
jgi:signal transduction histidine kinase